MTQATGSSFFTQAMALATANTTSTALPELIAFMGSRLGQTRANQLLAKVGHLLTLEQQYTLQETYLYGSSRLGVKNQNTTLSTRVASVQNGSLTPIGNAILNTDSVFSGTAAVYGLPKAPSAKIFNRTWGLKQYELSNHLGNVQVTISDKKIGVLSSNQVDFVAYEPEVKSATDYYAYGMEMPGKTYKSEEYKYGFGGKEAISSFYNNRNVYDFEARFFDSRIARTFSLDPHFKSYPFISGYSFLGNNSILIVDVDGRDNFIYLVFLPSSNSKLTTTQKNAIVAKINKSYRDLGLETRVKIVNPNSFDVTKLDPTDAVAVIGARKEVVNYIRKKVDKEFADNTLNTWEGGAENPERSENNGGKTSDNVIAVDVSEVEQASSNFGLSDEKSAIEKTVALCVIHGGGHNAGMIHAYEEGNRKDTKTNTSPIMRKAKDMFKILSNNESATPTFASIMHNDHEKNNDFVKYMQQRFGVNKAKAKQ